MEVNQETVISTCSLFNGFWNVCKQPQSLYIASFFGSCVSLYFYQKDRIDKHNKIDYASNPLSLVGTSLLTSLIYGSILQFFTPNYMIPHVVFTITGLSALRTLYSLIY